MKPRLPLLLLGAAFFACSLAPVLGGKSAPLKPLAAYWVQPLAITKSDRL